MPTPTPIPSSPIVQAVQASSNIIDSAVQQGIVGVLLLFAIAAVLFFAAQLLKTYFQRNNKNENSGQNDAIKAMAEMTTRSDAREERQQEERRLERSEWRKQIEDRDNKFIAAVNHLGDGYNRQGDFLARVVALQEGQEVNHSVDVSTLTAMKADVGQVLNLGSVPVRGLVESVTRIDVVLADVVAKVNQLPETVETAKQEILAAIEKCREAKSNIIPDDKTNIPPASEPETEDSQQEAAA